MELMEPIQILLRSSNRETPGAPKPPRQERSLQAAGVYHSAVYAVWAAGKKPQRRDERGEDWVSARSETIHCAAAESDWALLRFSQRSSRLCGSMGRARIAQSRRASEFLLERSAGFQPALGRREMISRLEASAPPAVADPLHRDRPRD